MAEESLERYIAIVEQAPKAPDGVEHFGNNFHAIFLGLRNQRAGAEPNIYYDLKLRQTEAQSGPAWDRFVAENESLIEQIEEVLPDLEQYQKIYSVWANLLLQHRDAEVRQIEAAGLHEVGNEIWGRLNPLLREAADRLAADGVDMSLLFA